MKVKEQSVEKMLTKDRAIFNKMFVVIMVIAFFNYNSSTMLSITLPKYANELGASAQAVGLLAGIFAMCALLMRPFSGQIVDNENKLVMLRVCLSVILVSLFGLTVSDKYWMLLVFRGLNGFAWGVGSTLMMTLASSCFSATNMATGIGIYGIGQTLARTVAPMFAFPFANRFGYNNLYYVNVALMTICLLLTFFLKIEYKPPQKRKYSIKLKDIVYFPAILPASVILCNSITKGSINAFLVIYALDIGIENIGIYFTIQAITVFAFRPLVSWLSDRFGTLKVLIPCELCIIVAMLVISSAHSILYFIVASILMGLALAGEQPILMAECVKYAPSEKRGSASNTSYIGVDVGVFIGSNIAGFLVAYAGYKKMFLGMSIPVAFATILYYMLVSKRRKHV